MTWPVLVTTSVRLAVEMVRLMKACENCKFGLSPRILVTSLGGFLRLDAAGGKGLIPDAANTLHIASLHKNLKLDTAQQGSDHLNAQHHTL